ncbi:predicted protein [Arabidopsis lyrata subsp. lyrata]|uniref:Predicted protein n=1 Tax=Arabidopsis lyrata subsp. lyrata TaxID=81972 RepID=D7KZB5_ARALL|nr:predicted protein [Arabidopsis lyrata subsp. lyrata]EFH65124.1 predicted protein [Arabidopsis lyrata subsp. lyrata]
MDGAFAAVVTCSFNLDWLTSPEIRLSLVVASSFGIHTPSRLTTHALILHVSQGDDPDLLQRGFNPRWFVAWKKRGINRLLLDE